MSAIGKDERRVRVETLASKLRKYYPHLSYKQRIAMAEIASSQRGDVSHAKDTR
jgi:hypothetical protein